MPDKTIEAEVLEIDGNPPPPPRDPGEERRARGQAPWEAIRGRVVRLDRRWWPLWVLLGIVALVLMLTVGVAVAVLVVVAKMIGGILRFLTGGAPSRPGGGLARRP